MTNPNQFRAVILTALPVEYDAVRAHVHVYKEDLHPEGDVYEVGRFAAGERAWDVGLVEMGMGNPNAAAKTERAVSHFKPDVVIFVGVAGGIKDAGIGDLVVATKVYGYHFGKAGDEFLPRPDLGLPGHRALERARAEARKEDWLKRLDHPGLPDQPDLPKPEPKPRVFLGAIAAGEQVVISTQSESYKLIRKNYNDALALEMEGYGVFKALQTFSNVEALVVRGVSDTLEGKDKADQGGSQERAARHAAAFAFEVLAKLSLPEKNTRVETREVIREVSVPAAPAEVKVHSTLPHQPYFVGRVKELAQIAEAIAPENRGWGALIDGPGGIGKTALAVRAASLAPAEHFPLRLFVSAKVRELTPAGETPLEDYLLPNYQALLKELACQMGEDLEKTDPNERARAVTRALSERRALLVIDNVETFPDPERARLYQFLARLPAACKAIVTSRRRTDIDARTVRLDRLLPDEALAYLAELAKNNRHLARASQAERQELYAITHGNPLLLRWLVGQIGREGSRCRTAAEACAYLEQAPKDNDPLEYIFGDLLDTFSPGETAVLAALTFFSQPAQVLWIAEIARLAEPAAATALEDLADRALLVMDEAGEQFYLPPLTAAYLRRRRPELVAQAGSRLADRAAALVFENGYQEYERFPALEVAWPQIEAALPLLVAGANKRLQRVSVALKNFLHFSGRWDAWLALESQAEQKALAQADWRSAGWRALMAGHIHHLRGQAEDIMACAERSAAHFERAGAGGSEKAAAIGLRGLGHKQAKDYPAAAAAYQQALDLWRAISPESVDVAIGLNSLAGVEHLQKDYPAAERHFREVLRIAQKLGNREIEASSYGNLASLALKQEDWASAETLALQALPLAEKIGRLELIGGSCHNLAKALARLGRPAEGLPYARKALEIFTRLGMPNNLEEARGTLQECEVGG